MVENGAERKIKTFRTDRGGEFMPHEFKNYSEEAGIIRHHTAPYTPQQNGVVERRNRTMMEMARSFLKEMKLPAMFWGEAVRHSVYVLNRLPTRALTGVTPYEAWSEKGRKPDVGYIKVFSCTAHMRVPSKGINKMADRSICVVNLGKEPGSKAFRLYDPKEKRIYVSKDVVFEESKPWVWDDLNKDVKFQETTFYIPAEMVERQGNSEQFVDDTGVTDNNVDQSGTPQESDGNDTPYHLDSDNYDDSVEPRKTRAIADVYNDTEEVTTEEELYLMGVEEPANYHDASKDRN